MPSFYPRHNMPRQLPLTPPEFVPNYHSGCGGMPYQQPAYSGQPGIRQQDDGYDFADRYGQLSIAMPPMYPQAGTYLSNTAPSLPPPSSFYEPVGAPILPPMRMQSGHSMAEASLQQQRAQELNQRATQQAKDEKPVGGVSAKLDYDMDVMTDFVCEMALQLITPGRMMPPSFRKWVHQVLCATRLPSATILLSMFYLSTRMPMLAGVSKIDSHLFRLLTIALVLGSKFLDDNTFINRSWSEVSGIPVADLNQLEMEWLVAIEFKLHRDPTEQQGWISWSDHWKDYQSHATARANRSSKLSPIDTSVQRQRSINQNKPLPPLPMQQSFNSPPYEFTPKSAQTSYSAAPSFSQYDPWRSANDHSPASAPTTGPTTPEYYGPTGTWAPEGYSRRTMFGFPSLSQPTPPPTQQQHHPSNYGPPAYSAPYQPPVWNNHGFNCGCTYCAQRHPPYFMAPGFGPQAVAV
ncbi:hypothetical protein BU26DRAFT_93335 [Trematosphaeria pertusa]|uniref:Cyclin-like protein n=1 Tax=Trematosphaeria pertusa TaxID=390896 RepID=A0A6A6I1D4_9PLEO|nr:uncharacterized protein BU26DRAFT_93335 [Trematosphaeria pertusa]KAF2244086.1 hypothetical protein BU26DRAFT_93335 [Trematosphaeria pertusa]